MANLKGIIEALIFASDQALTVEKITEVVHEVRREEVVQTLHQLIDEYKDRDGGIIIKSVAGGYQFRTREEFAPWIAKLKAGRPASLTQASLETLAIIAYRQPIVKADIERLRGVEVSGTLKGLLQKKLIRIMGRKDVPGRPIIYGTTKRFLEVFGLKDLSELPTLKELRDLEG